MVGLWVGDAATQLPDLVLRGKHAGDREPRSPGTVKHAYDMLRRVPKYAEQLKAIAINPQAIEFTANGGTGNRGRFESAKCRFESDLGALRKAW